METTENGLCCKLTSPELQERKKTVLSVLRGEILEKQEVQDGYVYTFGGSDGMLDQLASFIKTERECCPFFKFELVIQNADSNIRLKISGPEGAKDFITNELDL